MTHLYDFIWVLFHPSFWLVQDAYNEGWDKALNEAIDNKAIVTKQGDCRVVLEGLEIWVANYPYAYGTNTVAGIRPSRRTINKLANYIIYNSRIPNE